MTRKMTIVRLPPQDKAVYFVIERDMDEYAVEEGRCPNDLFICGCEAVIVDGDTDPHGLFDFVKVIDRPEFLNRGHSPSVEWAKIIPEAFIGEHPSNDDGTQPAQTQVVA